MKAGKVMAARSGQGRTSRPEILTMRAASQTLNRLISVENTAAAAGTTITSKSITD